MKEGQREENLNQRLSQNAVVQDLVSKSKSLKNRSPLQSMKASYPMQRVAVDIVGPSPQTAKGNLYVLVAAGS